MAKDARRRGVDALDRYLDEIGRHPTLSRQEEARLTRRFRASGDRRALEALVTANLRFVVAVAKGYRGRGLPLEDLINEGNVGLLRAAARFDDGRGVRFVSYAAWWIRQSILAALAKAGGPPPAAPGRPERGAGARGGARPPRARRPTSVSLETPGDRSPGGRPLAERLPDERGEAPDAPLHRTELRRALEAGLTFLPAREARVLRLFYGLDGGGGRSLAGIGREMGVSRERVRQIKARALARLREGPRRAELRSFSGGGTPVEPGGMKVDTPEGRG